MKNIFADNIQESVGEVGWCVTCFEGSGLPVLDALD